MWLLFACGSALFAGVTAVLAKIGMQHINSTIATALRTIIVLLFSWLMVLLTGAFSGIGSISGKTLVFLLLSGCATGASWLCYFKALQLGDVSQVAPIDKSSTILTMLLAFLLLGESLTWLKLCCMLLIGAGTFLMLPKHSGDLKTVSSKKGWLFYAILSAVFASLTSILGKVGIQDIDSNLGTAIRTDGMGHGVCHRATAQYARLEPERSAFPGAVRSDHRVVLAVLLPGIAGRSGERCCPH